MYAPSLAHRRQATLPVLFDEGFLTDHVGPMLKDPCLAVVELVSNAYDAGATQVNITWPSATDGNFEIRDNGTGLTKADFLQRWATLSYNRLREQGHGVTFPPTTDKGLTRRAFGRHGKGRHSAFCFNDRYEVEFSKGGWNRKWIVELVRGGSTPFSFSAGESVRSSAHGLAIRTKVSRFWVSEDQIANAIASRFLVDPSFKVLLNGQELVLGDWEPAETKQGRSASGRTYTVHLLDSQRRSKSTHLHGITWWVNGKMVGAPSWNGLDEHGAILDGRSTPARTYSFVVVADELADFVKSDWKAFEATDEVQTELKTVLGTINCWLQELMGGFRKERKQAAIRENASAVENMPSVARARIGRFVDNVLERCPSIKAEDLERTLEVFITMEGSRTGTEILQRLAACSAADIDTWNEIVSQWSAEDARTVLSELEWRLRLIHQLEGLVNSTNTDELHDLQPLFERGLWVFGPEFERIDFTSNRTLATILREHLGGSGTVIDRPKLRPDFVVLPDRSLGVYSSDSYDANGEVDGLDHLLIVELKKGGFEITSQEVSQATMYAQYVRKGNRVRETASITVYVLGSKLHEFAQEEVKTGDQIIVRPMQYDVFLKRAHARTFKLLEKIRSKHPEFLVDQDVEEAVPQKILEI